MHLMRVRVHGEPGEVETLKPGGSRIKSKTGYVRVHAPTHPNSNCDGYVLEHRLVMEKMLGRPLAEWENVHHLNGLRDDNRPENLELWAVPQPSGRRVSDLVNWVVAYYRDEVIARLER